MKRVLGDKRQGALAKRPVDRARGAAAERWGHLLGIGPRPLTPMNEAIHAGRIAFCRGRKGSSLLVSALRADRGVPEIAAPTGQTDTFSHTHTHAHMGAHMLHTVQTCTYGCSHMSALTEGHNY